MRALIDTSVWFRRYHRLPLSAALESFLADEVTEFFLSPISILEITYKWRHGRLPCPPPEQWLDDAVEHYRLLPVTLTIARHAGLCGVYALRLSWRRHRSSGNFLCLYWL